MHCAGLDYFVDVHVGVGDERWALPVGSRALETPRLVVSMWEGQTGRKHGCGTHCQQLQHQRLADCLPCSRLLLSSDSES